MSKAKKVAHVKSQGQTRQHHCHWPGCKEQVPPAKWGCTKHWFMLPRSLRERIWSAYRIGQEKDMRPSREYVQVAREVQDWIKENR
jgi:CDP-diacylglycerol pyrophosphatase